MILSDKRIPKAFIRLHRCVGWSEPLLFANTRRQVFSHRGPLLDFRCFFYGRLCELGWMHNTYKKELVLPNIIWFYLIN